MTEGGRRPRVFSGIQPTGRLHLGNYVGAMRQWVARQDEADNIFCVVDLHALTIPEEIDPAKLRDEIREVAALILAVGIDPERTPVFVQSHVSAHAELTWLLNCVTPTGWLFKMHQYKSKSEGKESVGAGLLDYPVLMAADIVLYDTDQVPVGEDQKQHVEATRDIAQRFNRVFGEVFVIPEPVIPEVGARVMGFDDPNEKMSKSLADKRPNHAVLLMDPPDRVRQVLQRAMTDSGNEVRFARASPGVRNLLELYEALTGERRAEIERRFAGKGYESLKSGVAEAIVETLRPIQERAQVLLGDPAELDRLLAQSADRVRPRAEATLVRAMEAMGLLRAAQRRPTPV